MSSMQPALANWWKGDRKILLIFALYGLAAGTITYSARLSDAEALGWASIVANFPTIMAIYFATGGYTPILMSFFHVIVISSSVAMWSFIGLAIYALVKMLRLEP